MPSLFRFLVFLGVLAGLAYGAMFAVVLYVEPNTREMSEIVPTSKINPVRIQPPATATVEPDEAPAQ